jgi:hypothetical protein
MWMPKRPSLEINWIHIESFAMVLTAYGDTRVHEVLANRIN